MGWQLKGATVTPTLGAQVANAGEFAAMFNAMSADERETFVINLRRNQDDAIRCLTERHTGRLETAEGYWR